MIAEPVSSFSFVFFLENPEWGNSFGGDSLPTYFYFLCIIDYLFQVFCRVLIIILLSIVSEWVPVR